MAKQEEEFITIGRVLAPFGIKGKMKVSSLTDFPERFSPGETVYIDGTAYTIESAEWHKGNALVKLDGIDTIEAAEEFDNKYVEISPSQLHPLAEGQFYQYQIIGLRALTTGGQELGTVTDILTSSANDIYVIKGKDGEFLIPATADCVKSIDLDTKTMVVEAIPGLLDLNRKTSGTEE